jgi:hypothetical protein
MPVASGVAKKLAYKVEASLNAAPGTDGQYLRRVESSLDLVKDTFESGEIRSDYQVADFRHGTRRVQGSVKGELSPKTYADFIAAALRRDFAAVTAISGLTLTVAVSGGAYTITRSAGDFLSGGIRIGQVIRLSGGTLAGDTTAKNLFVTNVTALTITVRVVNGSTMTAPQSNIASCTVTVVGKVTYTPQTGHTDKSFWIEHWFSDVSLSEQFGGCKVNSIKMTMPPSGMATIDVGFLGMNMTTAGAQYFSAAAAATSTGVVASASGVLTLGDAAPYAPILTVTGLEVNIEGGMSTEPVVGSNYSPNVFPGRVRVSGQVSVLLESAALRDLFVNESVANLSFVLATGNGAADDFIAVSMPRVKLGGAGKSDGEKGIIQTLPFVALLSGAAAGTATENTTLMLQDSAA